MNLKALISRFSLCNWSEIKVSYSWMMATFRWPMAKEKQVVGQVERLLTIFETGHSREKLQSRLGLKHRDSFVNSYLKPALTSALIEMTIPDKPRSRLQKYRLTEKGKAIVKKRGDDER